MKVSGEGVGVGVSERDGGGDGVSAGSAVWAGEVSGVGCSDDGAGFLGTHPRAAPSQNKAASHRDIPGARFSHFRMLLRPYRSQAKRVRMMQIKLNAIMGIAGIGVRLAR